jgi:hypothetical protein
MFELEGYSGPSTSFSNSNTLGLNAMLSSSSPKIRPAIFHLLSLPSERHIRTRHEKTCARDGSPGNAIHFGSGISKSYVEAALIAERIAIVYPLLGGKAIAVRRPVIGERNRRASRE